MSCHFGHREDSLAILLLTSDTIHSCTIIRLYYDTIIICYLLIYFLKKNQNARRPSEHPPVRGGKMSKHLGGIKGCTYKTSSWHLNGFPDGNNVESAV